MRHISCVCGMLYALRTQPTTRTGLVSWVKLLPSAHILGAQRLHTLAGSSAPGAQRLHTLAGASVPGARRLHTSAQHQFLDARDKDHHEKEKQMVVRKGNIFDEAAKKARDKRTYQEAVHKYIKRGDKYRRAHVEFIYAALSRMKEFGVHRDLGVYKQIIDLFPRGKMVAQTVWQKEMMHYPKQQQCAIDVLDQMEENGVVPDDAMGYQLVEIFGKESHAFYKYQRMMYWLPKFKNMNPYQLPYELPDDPLELAKLALKRMAVDLENRISVFQTSELDTAQDQTFIVSAQSIGQQELLANHPSDKAVYVEGGFTVWLRDKLLTYFILRADVTDKVQVSKELEAKKDEDLFNWKLFNGEKDDAMSGSLVPKPSVHEQDDGTVLAMCITGTSSKDSLISWIRFLQDSNPTLADMPVLFLLQTRQAEIKLYEEEREEQQGVLPQ